MSDIGTHRFRVARAVTKVVDAQAGRVHAILSTEAKDRDGDVIRQAGWDLTQFLKHPVLISSHDYRSLRSQIGEWEDVKVRGKQLEGVARYYIGQGNEEADWGFKLAEMNRAAYSVGFIPDMAKAKLLDEDEDNWAINYEFNGQELLETSHVTIPSNPEALQAMKVLKLNPVVEELVKEQLGERSPIRLDLPTAKEQLEVIRWDDASSWPTREELLALIRVAMTPLSTVGERLDHEDQGPDSDNAHDPDGEDEGLIDLNGILREAYRQASREVL